MDALTAAGLAGLAGVPKAEIGRMADLGVLVPREGSAPFLTGDFHKVRLAMACERAGLPMDGIAAAIRAGRLSFAFLEASSYTRWAVPSGRTYRQVSEETGIPLEVLQETLRVYGVRLGLPDRTGPDGHLPPPAGAGLDRAPGGEHRGRARGGGAIARPERVPAMCFLDLTGYTRLTEERGDQAAAELAGSLAILVERSSRAHGGTPVKAGLRVSRRPA